MNNKRWKTLLYVLTVCGLALIGTTGCSSSSKEELQKVTQVVNWFPQPEHGGQFAALAKGYYKEAGMDMTILPGGPQVSSIQQVASGKVQFGLAQADELLVARDQGIPVVAIAAPFQINPQAIMYHAEESIQDVKDLEGRTLYIAPGAMYWEYLKKKYELKNFTELAFTGNNAGFIADQKSATQSYYSSDEYILKNQNVNVKFMLIHDTGYQPYANVLFTTEKMIKEQPELVKAYVKASVKGWQNYKTNYEEINPIIQKENPDLTLESMKATAENMVKLVYMNDAESGGVGIMTSERWTTLAGQLAEIGLIKSSDEADKVFTTEFLPK